MKTPLFPFGAILNSRRSTKFSYILSVRSQPLPLPLQNSSASRAFQSPAPITAHPAISLPLNSGLNPLSSSPAPATETEQQDTVTARTNRTALGSLILSPLRNR